MDHGTEPRKPSFKELGTLAGFIVEFLASILCFDQINYWLKHKNKLKHPTENI